MLSQNSRLCLETTETAATCGADSPAKGSCNASCNTHLKPQGFLLVVRPQQQEPVLASEDMVGDDAECIDICLLRQPHDPEGSIWILEMTRRHIHILDE